MLEEGSLHHVCSLPPTPACLQVGSMVSVASTLHSELNVPVEVIGTGLSLSRMPCPWQGATAMAQSVSRGAETEVCSPALPCPCLCEPCRKLNEPPLLDPGRIGSCAGDVCRPAASQRCRAHCELLHPGAGSLHAAHHSLHAMPPAPSPEPPTDGTRSTWLCQSLPGALS